MVTNKPAKRLPLIAWVLFDMQPLTQAARFHFLQHHTSKLDLAALMHELVSAGIKSNKNQSIDNWL
jgi:hypothetical protein